MKKAFKILFWVGFACFLVGLLFLFVREYKRSTPEYALTEIILDCKKDGYEGFKRHLTVNALETLESLEDKGSELDDSLVTRLLKKKAIQYLKSKFSEIEWTVEGIMKEENQTEIVVAFKYEDKISGHIRILMIKAGKKWKIDGVSSLELEKISLE